jgi:hypothetical protein
MSTKTGENRQHCPECGAPLVEGLTCWEQLGAIGAWEWQDPALLAVHFLTVASYNLQHPAQFTEEAWAGLRAAFIEHLDHGMAVKEIRRRMGQLAEGKQRVLKDEVDRRPSLRRWSMTIADVYIPDKPQGAADRVKTWAASIRDELS